MAARGLVPHDECDVADRKPVELTDAQIERAYRDLKREKVVAMREAREKAEQEHGPAPDDQASGMFHGKPSP